MKRSLQIKASSPLKILLASCLIAMLGACASTPQNTTGPDDSVVQEKNVDSLEGFNRAVFSFNDTIDRWVLKPVAKGYDWVLPTPVKAGIGNFFDNLGEVTNIVNDGLQWKWGQAAHDSGRFLINTTAGVLGIFDVASNIGLEKSDGESFTQTLGAWGVPRGSYLVLPFWGPTTVRGGVSLPVDWVTSPINYLDSTNAQIGANAVSIIHDRSELLSTEELISGDRYLFVREVFLQRLEFLENDGQVEDTFGDEFEDDEYGGYE